MRPSKIQGNTNDVERYAQEYADLNAKRLKLDAKAREIKKKLDKLKQSIQTTIGTAEQLNVPYVTQAGKYHVLQVKKAREVKAYSYEFVEFSISQENT